jgi:hypothetical protein
VQATAGSRKAAKDAKQGSFFFAKKKAVLAFLCVLAPLREAPFHAEATAGSRKAAKHAKDPKKARLGLSGRDLLLFFALLASFAVPVLYFSLLGIPQLVVRSPLLERKSR